jgi:PLAT/LH2 domain
MSKSPQTTYLFLLVRSSAILRREAAGRLRELGLRVVAQYGTVAIEALASSDEADAALETGLFSARLSGAMLAENMKNLSDEQRSVVAQWNTRFTPRYRRLVKDFTNRGKSWGGDKDLAEPMPYSQIDKEEFLRLLEDYEKTNDVLIRPPARGRKQKNLPKPMTPGEFQRYERKLAKIYNDESLAYHLARLAFQLGPRYYQMLTHLPLDLVNIIIKLFFEEAECWRMDGEIAVGIVFIESSRDGGPKFGSAERSEICQEIFDGHSWLASQHPTGNLSWVYDTQFIQIDVANGTGDPDEAYWRDPAMDEVTFNGNNYTADWPGVASYREDLRQANWAAHAIVIFVTPYANSWHAYASSGRITLANKNNWGGWGRGALDMITAHETSHLFGSADEYSGSGTPCSSCDTLHGCDRIPNGNCASCSHPHQDCVMDGNSRRLCAYTRGQIGWGHLFVETTTADELWAGTDDDVWLDIGDRTFVLDTSDRDDRERNNREAYAFYQPNLGRDEIRRILIRKSEDGFAGGWKLQGVRVWYRGDLICNEARINQWLEDDHRVWVGCVNDRNYVSSLSVRITTADVMWAGTDDDVTLTLAGRSWNLDNSWHDDFERGNTDTFELDPRTGLRVSDIHSVRIHKSPDGLAGGWKLKGVRLLVNGSAIYNNQSINSWLEDDDRTWSDVF